MRSLYKTLILVVLPLLLSSICMWQAQPAEEIPDMPDVEVPSTDATKELAREVIGKVNKTMYRIKAPGIIAGYHAELNKASEVTEATLEVRWIAGQSLVSVKAKEDLSRFDFRDISSPMIMLWDKTLLWGISKLNAFAAPEVPGPVAPPLLQLTHHFETQSFGQARELVQLPILARRHEHRPALLRFSSSLLGHAPIISCIVCEPRASRSASAGSSATRK